MDPSERWSRTCREIAPAPPSALFDELVAAYGEPHRAYHTMQHLSECFPYLDGAALEPADRGSLELALWFHDAVYDPRASDNEARSAAWARSALHGLEARTLDRIEQLILVTRHDAAASGCDQELLLDIDLSILGANPDRFAEYESQRSRVLRQFIERQPIYHTSHFRGLLEDQARDNLRRSLDSLAG